MLMTSNRDLEELPPMFGDPLFASVIMAAVKYGWIRLAGLDWIQ